MSINIRSFRFKDPRLHKLKPSSLYLYNGDGPVYKLTLSVPTGPRKAITKWDRFQSRWWKSNDGKEHAQRIVRVVDDANNAMTNEWTSMGNTRPETRASKVERIRRMMIGVDKSKKARDERKKAKQEKLEQRLKASKKLDRFRRFNFNKDFVRLGKHVTPQEYAKFMDAEYERDVARRKKSKITYFKKR